MKKIISTRTIYRIQENVYIDTDADAMKASPRQVLWRTPILVSGTADKSQQPPDTFVGKRVFIVQVATPNGPQMRQIPLECIISPDSDGKIVATNAEEAFDLFDDAMKPRYEHAMQQVAKQMAAQGMPPMADPNHIASPTDGPAFAQAAAMAKAHENKIVGKGKIVIPGR